MTRSEVNRARPANKKLMIIYPYSGCGKMIRSLSSTCPYRPLLVDGETLDDNLKRKIDGLLRQNFAPDAIIGRGIVTTYVSKLFPSSSIIRIDPNSIDILSPLKQARRYGDALAILSYPQQGIEESVEMFADIFGFRMINVYPFHTSADIDQQIATAKRDGMNSIIGGGTYGLEAAKAAGISATFVETSPTSIRKALEQSISIIESRQKERERMENIVSIINCMSEGILATKNNSVHFSNVALSHIMGLRLQDYSKRHLRDLNEQIDAFVGDGGAMRDVIVLNGRKYLMEKLSQPMPCSESIIIFRNVAELQDKEENLRKVLHESKCSAKYTFRDIVGESPRIREAVANATKYSKTDAEILLTGETGTGKELFAQSIHNHSLRKDRPFIAVNCGAIPELLLESELFGYVEGAFTGARRKGKIGLFELAHKGTIFLDEIDSLPIALQGKLLRVIQEKAFRRVGAESETVVDVRVLSSSNKDLLSLIPKGEFRADLFYRISTLTLSIPSLSERQDDIVLLANAFVAAYGARYKKIVPSLSQDQIAALKKHRWTGNVRGLENVIHRYVVLYDRDCGHNLLPSLFDPVAAPLRAASSDDTICLKKDTLDNMERTIITTVLSELRWNRQETADRLGISRSTLWRKLGRE
jgi:transcriptional regulator with PAS, ATPase and Fis domain